MVTVMLLACSLPVFAQETDVIPIGGEWLSYKNIEQPFNSLQAACEFEFNRLYKDGKVSFSDCTLFRLANKQTYTAYVGAFGVGFGSCFIETQKIEYKIINGKSIEICTGVFESAQIIQTRSVSLFIKLL